MCISGVCMAKPSVKKSEQHTSNGIDSFGNVIVIVQRAHVPTKDKQSKSDPYVEVYVQHSNQNGELGDEVMLGKTLIVSRCGVLIRYVT